jgi:hypothetical protein
MGKEIESIVDDMKASLGLEEEQESPAQEPQEQGAVTQESDDKTEPKADEAKSVITVAQTETQKEIVKLDLQIEQLQAKSVDMDAFYANIDDHLSEEEQALEFEDKSSYMKLINKKAKEYEEKNSNTTAINELVEKKAELEKAKQAEQNNAKSANIARSD